MNFDPFVTEDREARIRYLPSDYEILSPGGYVLCAVTGARIALDRLRYWNPRLQEAYLDGQVATRRHEELRNGQAQ